MKGRKIKWSHEELAWIKENCTMPRKQAHEEFCNLFDRSDIKLTAFKALCKRNGWLTGRSGQYQKGDIPANKGKKMPYNANSARTQFKKGHRGGKAKEKYKPIGTERLSKDGYLERKVHDGMPFQSRWRAVHLINWEKVNGEIPEGHCLKCLDGNKSNTEASNWVCIPRSMLPRLAGRWGIAYDDAPEELKPSILATAKLDNTVRNIKNKQ